MVQIQRETSIRAGETIIIRIPDDQIDKNAFLTIQHEKPHFLLPFTTKQVDNEIVMTYTLEKAVKLSFRLGGIDRRNHIDAFIDLLKVLVEDCDDWFMKFNSFVLETDYLYEAEGNIKLLYVPTITPYSGLSQLNQLVSDLFRACKMNDLNLENRILREMQDFQPAQMLRSLREYGQSAKAPIASPVPPEASALPPVASPAQPKVAAPNAVPPTPTPAPAAHIVSTPPSDEPKHSGDIQIQFTSPTKDKGKKKEGKEKKANSLFGGFGKKKTPETIEPTPHMPNALPSMAPTAGMDSDVTEIVGNETQQARFIYIGTQSHDRCIPLAIGASQVFTIGRVDATVGRKQCDFEFHNKTHAVSRRHAAVERKEDGYYITDLGSSAGTYQNNQRLMAGSYRIQEGDKISFGNAGADYLFHE